MSKFIPPQTTTAIRIANTPLKGELLFDTNLNKLFIGDGITVGGIEVGTEGGTVDFTNITTNNITILDSLTLDTATITGIPDADTDTKGIAETATDDEAIAETLTDKIITPSNLGAWIATKGFITQVPPVVIPVASTTERGIAEIATSNEVIAGVSPDTFVTPATLEAWRIANNITAEATVAFTIYVSQDAFHSLSGSLRDNDPNHGDRVTYAQYKANITNPANEGNYWQLFYPESANFRCLGSLKDVADYGNENLSTSDTLTLYMDAGKYECNYTFNFALLVNGVNGRGISTWGDPDNIINEGLVFYTTTDYAVGLATKVIVYYSKSMIINSEATTRIQYVNFWSWVTATKDSTLTWDNGLKAIGEDTIEEHWTKIDTEVYNNYPTVFRYKYIGSYYGLGGYRPLIRLQGTGDKIINYCTFSGIGTSALKINTDSFRGGYLFVENSCTLSLKGIVLRGNEEIRVSDKRGRKITTTLSTTPVYHPPDNTEKGNDSSWVYEPIYDSNGDFDATCIGYFNLVGVFHDPYSEEWVSIGFCDVFLGIAENVELKLDLSEGFTSNLAYFGTNQPATFYSNVNPDGSFTLNHDLKCIRVEKNQGKLFGNTDDRVIGGQNSSGLTGVNKYRFRGTDILGKKIANLYPPTLTYSNGDVANKNAPVNSERDAFQTWITDFKNQGSTICYFINSKYNFTISFGEYDLWADRDCSGNITGQGIIGQFGYLLRTSGVKIQPILAYDYFSSNSPYGKSIVFNEGAVGSKIVMGDQFQYNIFKPVWTGFNNGKYLYPVIVDVGANYSSYLADVTSNPPNFSNVVTAILGLGHTLNGENVGARFIVVGSGTNENFSIQYLGYSNSTPVEYYFILFGGNAQGVGIYKSSTVINNISGLSGLSGSINNLYVRDSNILLKNKNYDNDVTNIKTWQPVDVGEVELPLYNASNLGLIANNYKIGLHTNKYGIYINLTNNDEITEAQITKTVSNIYTGCGYPSSLNTNSSDYSTLIAMFKSGFYAKNKFEGLFLILFSSTIQVTG